jgi:hypothetical protein
MHTAFWLFYVLLALQGYVIAIESVDAVTLPLRFTVAFAIVFALLLLFACVVLYLVASWGHTLWVGPGNPGRGVQSQSQDTTTQEATRRKRSLHKSALTAGVWVQDFDGYAQTQ